MYGKPPMGPMVGGGGVIVVAGMQSIALAAVAAGLVILGFVLMRVSRTRRMAKRSV
jgi:hypothetical protein